MPHCVYVQVHDRELSWRDAARDLKRNLLVRELLEGALVLCCYIITYN